MTFLFATMGIFLALGLPLSLGAQQQEEAEEEAPAYLLDTRIGDAEVDLFWQGYWRYRLSYGTGWEKGPGGTVFPAPFPGMQEGLEFKQEPDFFLSLLLMERYFLETSFTEGYDKNSYAMGYRGGDESPVKELRIGNAGIGMEEYGGIDSSSPAYNTPGISGRFETALSRHEFMIRYDPTEEQIKHFIGPYEVNREELGPADYIEGRYFVLPHRNISDLKVYSESSGGKFSGSDGRRYALLSGGFEQDDEEGLLVLDDAPAGRIVLFYRSEGSPVGDAAIATDAVPGADGGLRPDPDQSLEPFRWDAPDPYDPGGANFSETSQVTIDGEAGLLVHLPGRFSPFQSYNRYRYEAVLPAESWRTLISLEDRGTFPEEAEDFTFSAESSVLTVLAGGSGPRDPLNRFPFFRGNPELYGPGRVKDNAKVSRRIVIARKESSGAYLLGTGVVRGSVKVKVNGAEDPTASVDYDKGEIRFARYIFPEDRIEVRYRTEKTGLGGGDLFMAQGNRLFPTPHTQLELAESLRWAIPETKMSEEPGENPGEVNLAAAWRYEKENLTLTARGGLNLRVADTAGNLRLLGMEKSGYDFSLAADQVAPSEPELTLTDGDFPAADFSASKRVPLLYREFFSTDDAGQTYLNSYKWDAPEESSEEGPSLAGSYKDDPFSSRVMVMTYDLDGDEWAAGDYLPVAEELIDLSGYGELSFYLYRQNLEADKLELGLQLGENGEEEDRDDNGSVDEGDETYLITIPPGSISLPSQEGVWKKVTLSLSGSDRQKLSRVRSFRFVLRNQGSTGSSRGELLAAGFQGEGSPLLMKVLDGSGAEAAGKGDEIDATELSDSSLEAAFPEAEEIFHPKGEDQKILKIAWGSESKEGTGLGAGESWQGSAWMSGISPRDYGELVLYLKHGQSGGTGRIRLTDSEDKGIDLAYEPGSGGWEKLIIDLREGEASFSGSSSVSSLGLDKDAGRFTRFSIAMEGVSSGTLLLDEVHFSSPNLTTGASAEYDLRYARPGDWLQTEGGFGLLGNLNLSNRSSYYTEQTDSYFSDRSHRVESLINGGIDLMKVRVEGDAEVVYDGEEPQYALGHLIRIPAESPFGWFSDSYSRSFHRPADFMSRENQLYLTPFPGLTVQAKTGSDGSEGVLTQQWGGWINAAPGEDSALRLDVDFYRKGDWKDDSGGYWEEWISDFGHILPSDGQVIDRQAFGKGLFRYRGELFGLTWRPSLSYTAREEYDWSQENNWESELSFPLVFRSSGKEWTLEPGYSRRLEQTLYPKEHDGFGDDLDTLFRGLNSQFPLWHFIPFQEIFGDDPLDPFEETLTLTEDSLYRPALFLSLNRPPGSRPADFFLPSSLDLRFDREYRKKEDTLYWKNHWEFQYVQSAINLFGDYGSNPLFRFYQTDEWTNSLQFVLSSRESRTPEPEKLVYQTYAALWEGERWEAILDNSFSLDFQKDLRREDLQLLFRWKEPEKAWIKIPFRDRLIVKPNHLEHEEKLFFSGYFDGEDGENTSFDTTLTHQSKLVVQGVGSLRGWMALGLGGKQELFRNGYELGVELEITF